jgi:hypothetical protein
LLLSMIALGFVLMFVSVPAHAQPAAGAAAADGGEHSYFLTTNGAR